MLRPERKVVFTLTDSTYARAMAMAEKSGMTLDAWVELAVASAALVDEDHWRCIHDRDQMRREVDRTRFGILSERLNDLPESAVDALVETLVLAREQGREEGSEDARRLAAVRRTEKRE